MTVATELRDRLVNLVDAFDPDYDDTELVGYAETLFDACGNILTASYGDET